MTSSAKNTGKLPRPPVVVVLGHVDHGKTTLLDYIRKTNIAAREAGGITQSTAAYEIEHNGKKLTFIDTPGHEAFTAMRSRGASAADLAILVIAADDGVKPQTEESIKILQASATPFIVAINKIDKNNADIERAKRDLSEHGVLLEGMGGSISFQEISAKTGEGIPELLDLLLLAAAMEELNFNPSAPASGVVIETHRTKERGNKVIVIVKDGTLRLGDTIAAGAASGKVKILENFLGQSVKELTPSAPAIIIGFEELPSVGESFTDIPSTPTPAASLSPANRSHTSPDENTVPLIVKADSAGSLEAIVQIISALSVPEGVPRPLILERGLGDVTDSDIKQAAAAKAIVVAFNVKTAKSADNLARSYHLKIISSRIIYEIIKSVEDHIALSFKESVTPPSLEVLAVFNQNGNSKKTIGGRVISGAIRSGSRFELHRGEETITRGRVLSLEQNKQEVSSVESGKECGLVVDLPAEVSVSVGDSLVIIQ